MRTQRILVMVMLAWLCAAAGYAQPGYLGKRNILQADAWLMPSNLFYGVTGISHSYALGYHRVMSRRTVFGTGLTLLPLYKFEDVEYEGSFSPIYGEVVSRSYGLLIQAKFYPFLRKGWLAPLGPFVRIAVNLNRQVAIWTIPDGSRSHPWESHFWAGWQLETGYSTVFADRIQMDLGFRFCMAEFVNYIGDASSGRRYNLAQDIQQSELFKFHIGLGYLL